MPDQALWLAKHCDENKSSKTAHTSQDKDQKANQGRISHVKDGPRQAAEAHSSGPKDERVEEDIETSHAGTAKRPPLPAVILRAKHKVDQQDRRSRRRDDHQHIAEKEESEHVVDLAGPQRVHDKVELHENGTKGENTRQQERRDRTESADGRRDLTGDLVRLGRAFNSLHTRAVSYISTGYQKRKEKNIPVA